jgi:hypothetical protein
LTGPALPRPGRSVEASRTAATEVGTIRRLNLVAFM